MRGRDLVGLNVRRIRVAKGVSQERLAYDSGVDRSYLGGMERGEKNPTVDILDRLADTLGIPISELFVAEIGASENSKGLRRGRKPSSR
jgi:transcriptional regulator with XRE-family HTH domain